MATNFAGKGDILNVVAPTGGYSSGQIVPFVAMCGVALDSATGGELVAVAIEQEWSLPKTAGQAYAPGQQVYANGGVVTSLASGAVPLGFTTRSAATGDANAVVKLQGF